MKILLLSDIAGTYWYMPKGTIIDFPDHEAEKMIKSQLAEKAMSEAEESQTIKIKSNKRNKK